MGVGAQISHGRSAVGAQVGSGMGVNVGAACVGMTEDVAVGVGLICTTDAVGVAVGATTVLWPPPQETVPKIMLNRRSADRFPEITLHPSAASRTVCA
jgi:hypothetical protein